MALAPTGVRGAAASTLLTDRSRVRFDLGRDPRGPRQVREHRDEEEPSDGHGGDQEPQRVPATLVRGLMGEDRVELVLIEQFDEARRDDDARTEEPEAETEDLVGGDDLDVSQA